MSGAPASRFLQASRFPSFKVSRLSVAGNSGTLSPPEASVAACQFPAKEEW